MAEIQEGADRVCPNRDVWSKFAVFISVRRHCAGRTGMRCAHAARAVREVKILISNDDGYRAEGLRFLVEAMKPLADITVVAPDRNRSGASNSLTLDVPLRVTPYDDGSATTSTVRRPIACISRSPACSSKSPTWWSRASTTAPTSVTTCCIRAPLPPQWKAVSSGCRPSPCRWSSHAIRPTLRDRRARRGRAAAADPAHAAACGDHPQRQRARSAVGATRGLAATRLGHRHRVRARRSQHRIRAGRPIYWVGPAGAGQDAGPGTDFHAVAERLCVGHAAADRPDTPRSARDMRDWLGGRDASMERRRPASA